MNHGQTQSLAYRQRDGADGGGCQYAAVLLFPDGTINFINAWVHGLELSILRSVRPYTLGGRAYGLFGVTLTGFLVGALFACCYNLVDKCSCCRERKNHGD